MTFAEVALLADPDPVRTTSNVGQRSHEMIALRRLDVLSENAVDQVNAVSPYMNVSEVQRRWQGDTNDMSQWMSNHNRLSSEERRCWSDECAVQS